MTNKYTGKRIFYFDVLRVVAILSIILCHTARYYSPFDFTNLKVAIPGLMNVIGMVGVPLFFMISGALLLNRKYDLKVFFKKRFSRILLPAIFWIALTSILYMTFIPHESITKIIFGQHRYTWFIWTMIGIYLFIPIINSFIREYELKGVEYFLLIWAVTIILNTFNLYPFKELELSYFANYIGYVVLGYYLDNKKLRINNLVLTFLGLVLFIVFTLFSMYVTYFNLSINAGYLSISTVLASVGVFIMFKCLATYLENKKSKTHEKIKNSKIGNLVFLISTCSYGMYFANSVILKFLKKLDLHSLKFIPIIYISVVVLSFVIVYIFSKIPILKKFSGVG